MLSSEPFQYDISTEPEECQAHYEKLGAVVTNYVYQLLESKENMIRLPVPKDSTPDDGTFVYVSRDYNLKDVLLVLVQGSGAVRAGQWSRAYVYNSICRVNNKTHCCQNLRMRASKGGPFLCDNPWGRPTYNSGYLLAVKKLL